MPPVGDGVRAYGSLLPSLARIGHVTTCSCQTVWESEYLTISVSFMGGSACHLGRGDGRGCWGAIQRTCHTFFLQNMFIEHLTWQEPSTSTRPVSLLFCIFIFSVSHHIYKKFVYFIGIFKEPALGFIDRL